VGRFRVAENQLAAYDKMYQVHGEALPTIGIQASKFPGMDLDVSIPAIVAALKELAFNEMGGTISRGRDNSSRALLMYRAPESAGGEDLMRKMRHVYENAAGDKQAIEWLAHGQQYLIEGMHVSGVPYEWDWGNDPLSFGHDNLPVVTPDQVEAFFEKADLIMAAAGYTRVKGGDSLHMTSSSGAMYEIGPSHPELCPDLDMLKDLLENYLPVDLPDFSEYEEWEKALRAITTACGRDEQFYVDVVVPWNQANPVNDEADLRGKWEGYQETSLGWPYLCGIGHDHGYTADVEAAFGALPDDPGNPGQQPTPPAGPGNTSEQSLTDQFVKRYARKTLIHVPARSGGHWRRCVDGIWAEDFTAGYDARFICQVASTALRRNVSTIVRQPGG
jgi:hypothetical protein